VRISWQNWTKMLAKNAKRINLFLLLKVSFSETHFIFVNERVTIDVQMILARLRLLPIITKLKSFSDLVIGVIVHLPFSSYWGIFYVASCWLVKVTFSKCLCALVGKIEQKRWQRMQKNKKIRLRKMLISFWCQYYKAWLFIAGILTE
jgi:hypothetical protein